MSNTCFHFEPFSMKRKHKRWASTKGEQAAEQSCNPRLNQPKNGDLNNQKLEFKQPNWASQKIKTWSKVVIFHSPIHFPSVSHICCFNHVWRNHISVTSRAARRWWHGELPVLPTQLQCRGPPLGFMGKFPGENQGDYGRKCWFNVTGCWKFEAIPRIIYNLFFCFSWSSDAS